MEYAGLRYSRGSVINCTSGDMCDMYKDDNLTLEEADNRIVCHISHMIHGGISDILIRTVDTDVIIILLAFMAQFKHINDDIKIWFYFGTGEHQKIFTSIQYIQG